MPPPEPPITPNPSKPPQPDADPSRSPSTTDAILTHSRILRPEAMEAILTRNARETAGQLPGPRRRMRVPGRRGWRSRVAAAAIAIILLSGLYMRLDNLGNVQHWSGDSGRDYLVVMDWGIGRHWPLLGPSRITGDFTIGPGWFYTIAPALMLSGYDVAAGAATIGVLGIAGIALIFLWIRRSTGGALGGVAAAALLSWSVAWVESQRECWNPHPLFFGVAAAVWLIHDARRRPLRALGLYLMLLMILPQWHTTGWSVLLLSPPFFAWSLWRGRTRLRRRRRRAWVLWAIAVGVTFLLLYLPPVLHELSSRHGNMGAYFGNLLPPRGRGAGRPWSARLLDGALKLSRDTAVRNFNWFEGLGRAWHVWAHALMAAALAAALAWRRLSRPRFAEAPSVLFLIALAAGFWLVASGLDAAYQDYFAAAFYAVPVMLAGWAAGALLRRPRRLTAGRPIALALGLAVAGGLFWQAAAQLPDSWRIHDGRIWHGRECRRTLEVCKDILKWAGGRPFSFKLVEARGDTLGAHFHAMLWRGGNRPANRAYYGDTVPRNEMGRVLFLVARGPATRVPLATRNLIDWIDPPIADEGMLIYRIHPDNVPGRARALRFELRPDVLLVEPIDAAGRPRVAAIK